jgi:hypothetical protein
MMKCAVRHMATVASAVVAIGAASKATQLGRKVGGHLLPKASRIRSATGSDGSTNLSRMKTERK